VTRRKGFKHWTRDVQVVVNTRQPVDIDLEASTGTSESQCKKWHERELPLHQVAVEAFYLDTCEVTNALFERFVKATSHQTAAEREGWGNVRREQSGKWQWLKADGASWRSPNGPGSDAASDHPVAQVSWEDATAYCKWAEKRLPTEAEWEYAARGINGRRYPWGDAWDSQKANGDMRVRMTRPVGSYVAGASPFGIFDLAGNVWEWASSLCRPYPYSATDRREDLNASGSRVYRGGAWSSPPRELRVASRYRYNSTNRYRHLGFRCAQNVQ
jgi:formylglycine-generating enzyme required for sulfatase activity